MGQPQSHLYNHAIESLNSVIRHAIKKQEGIPDGRVSEKSRVAGNPGGLAKMDDAAEGLANGSELFYYRVR